MVGILTSKCATVYSLKGNTLGILEQVDLSNFDCCLINNEDPREYWFKSELILLGTSTYYPSFKQEQTRLPTYFKKYICELKKLSDKRIVLFGSGRSEYPLFCGALDYLENELNNKNKIEFVYKFEGYPKPSQKEEFKRLLEDVLNA